MVYFAYTHTLYMLCTAHLSMVGESILSVVNTRKFSPRNSYYISLIYESFLPRKFSYYTVHDDGNLLYGRAILGMVSFRIVLACKCVRANIQCQNSTCHFHFLVDGSEGYN